MPETAVVILNWNGKTFLEKFLPQLIVHTPDAELIIADNASEDTSIEFLKQHYPKIRRIQLDKNYGFAGGYNKALSQVDAKYYILLNSDIEVTKDWVTPLINTLKASPNTGACMPKILDWNHREDFEYAGACGGYIDKYGYPFCRGRILNTIEKDEGQYNESQKIFWATGACLAIRSELFHKLNGFDEDFFAHMEEIDLCWRIHHARKDIQVVPESLIYHVGGGTLPNESPFKLFLNFRNNLYLLYKNLPNNKLNSTLRIRFCLDYLAYATYILKGELKNAKAIRNAHKQFRKNRKDMHSKRMQIKKAPDNVFQGLIYPRSIIWDYMIKRYRKFSQLPLNRKHAS